ncbi:MAG: Rrf2 family transcriptional regulator [Sulfurovaceae bacterium]|nr:Rrf2 family transcriptional regulator [Sulfurovaceae bacterium]
MALISSKGIYGLGAMYELLKHDNNIPLKASQIAISADIPLNYLEQLLGKLKKAGLVKSVRGINGGFLLSKSPKDILIKDIIIALEDKIRVVDDKSNNHILDLFFDDIGNEIATMLSLSLVDLKKYQDRYNASLHYNI